MILTERFGTQRPFRVLVIDDVEDLVAVLLVLLAQEGYEVHGSHDGRAGLSRARELLPDLILLDHRMPHLSGCEVARALKQAPSTAHIKVIMHSSMHEEALRSLFDGFDAFHSKGHGPDALLALVGSFRRSSGIGIANLY